MAQLTYSALTLMRSSQGEQRFALNMAFQDPKALTAHADQSKFLYFPFYIAETAIDPMCSYFLLEEQVSYVLKPLSIQL